MTYEGIVTALVTPLREDGSLDELGLRKLIQFQLNKKVDGILVLGGTGEYLALSNEQRRKVIAIAINEVNDEVPVFVGLLSPGIQDNIYLGQYAKSAGAAAVMIITPYYLSPTQEGFIDYYKKIDKAIHMPILLYNYPAKTGVNMEPQTVEQLVNEIPHIIGIKECTYHTGQVIDLLKRVGDKITVYAGDEYSALAAMVLGAKGAVMASSNIVPEFWVQLWQFVKNERIQEAVELNKKYFPVFQAIFKESNPGPVKYILNKMNLPGGVASTPLLKLSEETMRSLDQVMKELGI